MYSRWSSAAVIILWCSAMGWLLVEKVLPLLLVGQPPSYREILAAQRGEPPVGWEISLAGQPVGWALSTTAELPEDVTEVRSWVHFRRLPLDELTPDGLRPLMRLVDEPVGNLTMDAENMTMIDGLGQLSSFRSDVRVAPLDALIRMQGTIEGSQLNLEINAGDLVYQTQLPAPQNALLSDSLSPRTQLPGIRPGQTWTVRVYSPLRPPNDPLDVLRATVEGTEPIVWDDQPLEALLVVYRSVTGNGRGRDERPRGRLWVRRDGTVLRQEAMIFNTTMTFVRLNPKQAAELEAEVAKRRENGVVVGR